LSGGQVLGAATEEPALPPQCSIYLADYLKIGRKNSEEEVKKLQSFLNDVMGLNLPLTGFFGQATHDAVKKFQLKYHKEIIQPWIDAGWGGSILNNGTGYVYKTTRRWINLMKCQALDIPLGALRPGAE
jgi:hypothetical protein